MGELPASVPLFAHLCQPEITELISSPEGKVAFVRYEQMTLPINHQQSTIRFQLTLHSVLDFLAIIGYNVG